MWHDVETTQDLLNFKVIADTVAKMIKDGDGQPISIGVSGNWGSGKSSLVKMIGESLKSLNENNVKDGENEYIFLDFNAWLYQGYDDARMALLQKVADKIMEESGSREKCIDEVKEFFKRINWLRVAKLVAPIATGIITGGAVPGSIDLLNQIAPDLPKVLNDKGKMSIPKEIEDFRQQFQAILKKLKLTLVILVDDLDRCLPDTAISTLEAMRLLLFTPQTVFIIAADEQMIRNAVRSHFGNIDLSDELVTSYFDKLIQIPLRVPRLGTNEVKGYLILLWADLAQRRGKITQEEKEKGYNAITTAIKKSWEGGLTKKTIEKAYGTAASQLATEIDLADQLANIMTTADHIEGNPRLIKRFLNNLVIRESVAKAQGMGIPFEVLVKLQLFERCASNSAFEFLAKEVGNSEDGKPEFIQKLEKGIDDGKKLTFPHESWKTPFISNWVELTPRLSGIDLRPLLYLSRDKAIALTSFDKLSPEGKALLEILCAAKEYTHPLVEKIKTIGLDEAEKVLTRMKRRARNQNWDSHVIIQTLHIPKAFPLLASSFIAMLDEVPPPQRPPSLIPHLRNETWAKNLLDRWGQDEKTPPTVKKAINIKPKEKR